MAKIKVKELKLGMTLEKDVCDPNGRFLLGEGCVLTDKHLTALSAWGVVSVEIISSDVPDIEKFTLSPEIAMVIEEQVNSRFKHNDENDPFIKELLVETSRFFVEKLEG